MESELTYTVDHTAKLLGLSPQTIRLWLQSENCPFGYAVCLNCYLNEVTNRKEGAETE